MIEPYATEKYQLRIVDYVTSIKKQSHDAVPYVNYCSLN
jgi:hypothetical protein